MNVSIKQEGKKKEREQVYESKPNMKDNLITSFNMIIAQQFYIIALFFSAFSFKVHAFLFLSE